jgi:hypothetical protein
MAKKKSSKANRKHQFKYASPQTTATAVVAKTSPAGGVATGTADERDFRYVGVDLRRIAWLGGSLILLQFVLWYIFTHTGVGPSIYNLVQI